MRGLGPGRDLWECARHARAPSGGRHCGERGWRPGTIWHRFAREGRRASAWIPAGPFAAATLRLPKAKDELDMAVHAAASVLEVGAPLLGVRSQRRGCEIGWPGY